MFYTTTNLGRITGDRNQEGFTISSFLSLSFRLLDSNKNI